MGKIKNNTKKQSNVYCNIYFSIGRVTASFKYDCLSIVCLDTNLHRLVDDN